MTLLLSGSKLPWIASVLAWKEAGFRLLLGVEEEADWCLLLKPRC